MRTALILAAILQPCLLTAGSDNDAAAALALALATQLATQKDKAAVAHAPQRIDDEPKAREAAIKQNKPLLIRYGEFDCTSVCTHIDGILCVHKDAKAKSFRVMLYQDGREPYWWYHDWDRLPSVDEVKQKVEEFRQKMPKPSAKGLLDWDL